MWIIFIYGLSHNYIVFINTLMYILSFAGILFAGFYAKRLNQAIIDFIKLEVQINDFIPSQNSLFYFIIIFEIILLVCLLIALFKREESPDIGSVCYHLSDFLWMFEFLYRSQVQTITGSFFYLDLIMNIFVVIGFIKTTIFVIYAGDGYRKYTFQNVMLQVLIFGGVLIVVLCLCFSRLTSIYHFIFLAIILPLMYFTFQLLPTMEIPWYLF